jgi:hypothetical protein
LQKRKQMGTINLLVKSAPNEQSFTH